MSNKKDQKSEKGGNNDYTRLANCINCSYYGRIFQPYHECVYGVIYERDCPRRNTWAWRK